MIQVSEFDREDSLGIYHVLANKYKDYFKVGVIRLGTES